MPGFKTFGRHLLLTTLAAGLLVWVFAALNAKYLFHTELYEIGDPGANSLSVERAGRFQELYGPYSRWGFHHPGPAVFYYSALLQSVCCSWLRVMPTPFNAQVLGTVILSVGFLCGGIGVAARHVRSRFFVPLIFLLAALHFTAVDARFIFTSTWSACVVPLIFFCLLVTAASVAAGEGRDLPLLVVAGSLLVHDHVAQPLFVLPMFLLAYLGLSWMGRQTALPAPWRVFPRAHWLAGALAFLFLLPLVVDLLKGSQSNLALILAHQRAGHGPGHSLLEAVSYFLRFGTYRAELGQAPPPGTSDLPAIGRYLTRHGEMMSLWSAAFLSPWLALLFRRRRARVLRAVVPGENAAPATTDVDPARWRFLVALVLVWVAGVALTLFWATIQDGEMFYYNAWFNHSIYFVLALIGAISLCDLVETFVPRSPWRTRLAIISGLVCLSLGAWVCLRHQEQFRCVEFTGPAEVIQANTVLGVLRQHPDAPCTKLLLFRHPAAWEDATGIAVLLERKGYRPRVLDGYKIMFGNDVALDRPLAEVLADPRCEPMEFWCLTLAESDWEAFAAHPLSEGFALQIGGAKVDPSSKMVISFAGQAPNAGNFELYGWTGPDGPQASFVWSLGKSAALIFNAKPVPAATAVEMTCDCFPLRIPGKPDAQRIGLRWNATDLGTQVVRADGLIRVLIPAALWNSHPGVLLRFDFPDAASPLELGQSQDPRLLAIGTRSITFRSVAALPP